MTVVLKLLFLCELSKMRWYMSGGVDIYPGLICPLLAHWVCWPKWPPDLLGSLFRKEDTLDSSVFGLEYQMCFNKHKSVFLVMLCSSAGDHVFWLLEVMADCLTSFTLPLRVLHWIIGMLISMTLQLFVVATPPSYYYASTNIKNIFWHRAYQATITVTFLT